MKKHKIMLIAVIVVNFNNYGICQKILEIINEPNCIVNYSFQPEYLKLKFVFSKEIWPSIKVDINQNGIIEKNFDRGYGIFRDSILCANFLIDEVASTSCGQYTNSKLFCFHNSFVFYFPYKEISNVENGKYYFYFPYWDEITFNELKSKGSFNQFNNLFVLEKEKFTRMNN